VTGMLRRMSKALSRLLADQLEKRIASLELELAIARKNPNVSLKDVKSAEKALEEARQALEEKRAS
jgi:hypothetical protein